MRKSHRLNPHAALDHLCLFLLAGLAYLPSCLAGETKTASMPAFRGSTAFADTKRAVSFGERPSGSAAITQLRAWISSELTSPELKRAGGELWLDSFQGATPNGPVLMVNLILKFPGTSGQAIAVTGHYDTKKIPMVHFLGANDGGSSTGFLMAFAQAVAKIKHPDDIYIVFFDGEEAVGAWSDADSLYGSRQLAAKWAADGTLSHLKALINVDMIGDKDLKIINDGNSSAALRFQVLQIAAKLGDRNHFESQVGGVDDDHIPFVKAGVNAIDIIDMTYGPAGPGLGAYWHTGEDTMDKLSSSSFQVVGDVVLELVKELER